MTTTIYDAAISAILDNYADAIEGGNTYRGSGTAYKGIAGTQSHNELSGTTVTAASGSTGTVTYNPAVLTDATAASLVVTDAPAFFFLCLTQATLTGNVGAARKITHHNASDNDLDVAPDFANDVAATDTFRVLEGFKRAPDNFDLEDEQASSETGWDRYFSLHAMPGVQEAWHGDGYVQYRTRLELRVRFNKASRARNAISAALENTLRMRAILTRGDLRDGTYTQLLEAESLPPEFEETAERVVVMDHYGLVYRVNTTYL